VSEAKIEISPKERCTVCRKPVGKQWFVIACKFDEGAVTGVCCDDPDCMLKLTMAHVESMERATHSKPNAH
jgi:hypothetical protein